MGSQSAKIRQVLIALGAVGFFVGASNPPPPSGGNLQKHEQRHAAKTASHADRDQRGSQNSPLFIKESKTPEEKQEAADIAQAEKDGAATNRGLLFATMALGLLAALQWVVMGVQTVFIGRSTRTTERALTELERPIVYGSVKNAGFAIAGPLGNGNDLVRSETSVCIYNFGRTLARLRRIQWDIALSPSGSIVPPLNPSVVGGRELPVGTVCANGDPYTESLNTRLLFFDEADQILRGGQSIWVTGFIRYDDIFGRHLISGFALVFDRIGGRFVRRGGGDYNYEREEKGENIPPPTT